MGRREDPPADRKTNVAFHRSTLSDRFPEAIEPPRE
jgi:hypothetical protein